MLAELQTNLESLISAYEQQKQKAQEMEKAAMDYKARLEDAKKKILKLEEEIGILKERTVFMPSTPDNYSTAKAKVDALIGDIDAALALLQ